MAEDITKVEPDSPNRCQAVTNLGQCMNSRLEGSEFCAVHTNRVAEAKKALHSYQLTKWRAQVQSHTEHDAVRSLVGEIGILRLTLETLLNQCESANDLIIHSNRIGELATKIEKTVGSCIRLEEKTGSSLSKDKILQIATKFIDVITRHVEDSAVLEAIADDIANIINE